MYQNHRQTNYLLCTFHCKCSALSFITILDLYFPLEMSEVLKSLEQVVYRWFDLGLQLGLSDGVLHAIEHDYQRIGDRKREMVSKWMTSPALNPTWCSLAKALHAIELHVVADKVSVEHCKWCSVCCFPSISPPTLSIRFGCEGISDSISCQDMHSQYIHNI